MPNYIRLVDIISGQKTGLWPAIIRNGLSCVTPFYRLAIGLRNWQYDRGQHISRVNAKVFSVGNLTTGGTGKTPLVVWLARYLSEVTEIAIVSRGYGVKPGEMNDEALEIQQQIAQIPHLQNPNRVDMARQAVNHLGVRAIILDDGFQHRALARDLDIVLIDATQPFGYDRLLPRGLLREPLSSLGRADVAVLTRSDLVSDRQRMEIRRRTLAQNPRLTWVESRIAATGLVTASGHQFSINELAGKKAFACCGIGNPIGFLSTLEQSGIHVAGQQIFRDHHKYSELDLIRVEANARQSGCEAIVCTLKDLVKIRRYQTASLPLCAITIEMEFTRGLERLQTKIDALLPRSPSGIERSGAEPGDEIAA